MPGAQQIHIKPHCSWNSSRQLPEERVSRIDISSLAIPRLQQSTLLRVFAGIMATQQRYEVIVPFIHEIKPAFLYPAVEIVGCDCIRTMEHSIYRRKDIDWSFLHRNPCPAQLRGIRREVSIVKISYTGVVLHD